VSPLEIDLLPGDYLVVAVMPDGRFHEVYRRVSKTMDVEGPEAFRYNRLLGDGKIGLATVWIPALDVHAGMTRVEGNESFPFGLRSKENADLVYSLAIEPLFVDNTEVTVADDATNGVQSTDSPESARSKSFAQSVSKAELSGKRLPTEAEYEYLATNGGTTKYPWGDDWPAEAAAIESVKAGDPFGPVGTPAFDRVARYPAVVGLASNKAEWVMPRLGPKLYAVTQRQEVTLETQIFRGGSTATIAGDPRVTPEDRNPRLRGEANSKVAYPGLGFRCVRSVEPLE
jgi:hypothetical protein